MTDVEFSWVSALSPLKPFRHLFNVLRLLNKLIILNILTLRALMSLKIYTGLYKNCMIQHTYALHGLLPVTPVSGSCTWTKMHELAIFCTILECCLGFSCLLNNLGGFSLSHLCSTFVTGRFFGLRPQKRLLSLYLNYNPTHLSRDLLVCLFWSAAFYGFVMAGWSLIHQADEHSWAVARFVLRMPPYGWRIVRL